MYNTWAYRCTKYERNRILSCDRDIDGPYRHSLLTSTLSKILYFIVSLCQLRESGRNGALSFKQI